MFLFKSKKFYIFLSLSAFVVFMLTLLFRMPKNEPKLFPLTVRLKWQHQAQFAGMYVAEKSGLYKAKGLEVNMLERDLTKGSVAEEVAAGKADFGLVSSYEFLRAANNGLPVVAVAAIYQKSPASFVFLSDKKIAKPKDFLGKIVGLVQDRDEQRLIFSSFLRKYNLPVNKLEYKEIGFNQVKALTSGKVDLVAAYRTEIVYGLKRDKVAFSVFNLEDFGLDTYDDVLITSRSFLQSHREQARNFVAATLAGWNSAIRNPQVAVNSSLAFAKGGYLNKDFQEYIFSQSLPLIQNKTGAIGEMTLERWEKIYKFLKIDLVSKTLDLEDFLEFHL